MEHMFDPGELEAISEALAHADVDAYSDDELLAFTVAAGHLLSAVQVAQAHALAKLDASGVTDTRHGMRTASWVAAQSGCARGAVANRLRVGRALRQRFTVIDDAVCSGALSYDHVQALVSRSNPRVEDALAATQHEIVTLATGATFDRWKNDVAALAEHADTDGAPPDPYVDNAVHLARTLHGTLDVSGSFDAANGLVFRTAIDAKADELFRRFTADRDESRDLEVPGRATLRALALIELLRVASGAEPGSGSVPRAEVTLVVHDHEVCDDQGVPLPRAAADVWGCDPDLWAVVVDHMGFPVDVGHTKRLATLAQRRALAVRDGGCTFPGCDHPIDWCDLHHVVHWEDGGATDVANLVALCRHHHGVTHRTGWSMSLDAEQVPHWITPSGEHLVGQRHRRSQDVHHRRKPDPPRPSPMPLLAPSAASEVLLTRC